MARAVEPTRERTRTLVREARDGLRPLPDEGRCRVVIEGVTPEIEAGRFPIKRTVGESVTVEADVFVDGHDAIVCTLLHRHAQETEWTRVRMTALVNDRWRGSFRVPALGRHRYTLEAWVDPFLTWRLDLKKRVDRADIAVALLIGADMVAAAGARAAGEDARTLRRYNVALLNSDVDLAIRRQTALDDALEQLVLQYAEPRFVTRYQRELIVLVDRERARFGAWYEFFPRSCGPTGVHGTFRDCESRLDYVAGLGFDVVYLPPIHPIGLAHRKGPNNTLIAGPADPGSPWAIGGVDGGHKALHPQLGTIDDFRWFQERVRERGMELALDIAFQCSPDHPYVKQHPDWFRHCPDGTIQFAENPPKKYEDIYPFDFESEDWAGLWRELESVFQFWVDEGVRIFRVDNPHTKPFPFWEWALGSLRDRYPDVIFLSEAFTRPRIMHRLSRVGFNQSYTYFTWRNTAEELALYIRELMHGQGREYMRPNLWPNTPDILTEYLQFGGRPAFLVRFTLAATLAASYGIYGPAFELCDSAPRQPGSEEYRDSEKYQLRDWPVDRDDSLGAFIARVNRIRRENPALHNDWNLRLLNIDNPAMIAWAKATPDLDNTLIVVVNLDPHHAQTAFLELPLEQLGLTPDRPYQMHDLLSDARYLWQGHRNYVALDPAIMPAHIFRVRHRLRTERDFEYFL